jgi:hypothetical protein
MRKSLSVAVLLLVLCSPTFAGDMLTPPVVPPSSPATSVASSPDDEILETAPSDESTTQGITVTEIAVSIFESLLAII